MSGQYITGTLWNRADSHLLLSSKTSQIISRQTLPTIQLSMEKHSPARQPHLPGGFWVVPGSGLSQDTGAGSLLRRTTLSLASCLHLLTSLICPSPHRLVSKTQKGAEATGKHNRCISQKLSQHSYLSDRIGRPTQRYLGYSQISGVALKKL